MKLTLKFKQCVSTILVVLLVLPVGSYAQKTEQEKIDETLALTNQSYSEFFRGLGETYQIDNNIWKKVQKLLRDEDTKETDTLTARIEELKQRRNALRKERKKYNDELSKIQVKIEQLNEKLENDKEKGKDVSAIEKEMELLRASAEEPTTKSNALKRELDGDTSFNMAEAAERLEILQDSLESATTVEQTRLKAEIVKLEADIEAASGFNRRIQNVERDKYLLETKNSHIFSKLDSLKTWPNKLRAIRNTIIAGKQGERKYGDVEEIGDLEKRTMRNFKVLKILPGTLSKENEIKFGRELAQEFLRQVKIHENQQITEYVNRLGQNLVRNSDAWCSFTFYTIADSPQAREMNAFALPGGQVFIHDTLILNMQSEGELAAVLAHEISHVTARHAAKMISKAQYGQIGTLAVGILFGGLAYQGAGLLLNTSLLGITRESETEADLLGTQYLWKAGYDPRLLEESFDRLLKYEKLGGSSFWRTHPSLDDRMERVEEEARYLPPQTEYLIGGQEFINVQQEIRKARLEINRERKEEEKKENRPKIKRPGEEDGQEPETPPILRRKPQSETSGEIPEETPTDQSN